jgi:hypothetical protein
MRNAVMRNAVVRNAFVRNAVMRNVFPPAVGMAAVGMAAVGMWAVFAAVEARGLEVAFTDAQPAEDRLVGAASAVLFDVEAVEQDAAILAPSDAEVALAAVMIGTTCHPPVGTGLVGVEAPRA